VANKKRLVLEFLQFLQLEILVKSDSVVITSADKKRAGLELLRFLKLKVSMYFYNFATFSADKAHKSLAYRRRIKMFPQVQPVCHDFCQVPFRFFSFFFSGVVVFISLHSIHTTTHSYSSKRASVHPFTPLHSILSFSPPHLLFHCSLRHFS